MVLGAYCGDRLSGVSGISAGLDVTETEPLQLDSPLRQLDNVFLTLHLAVPMTEARQKTLSCAAEHANRLARGERTLGVVDPSE